jgi:nucleoid-associated protein YgaU
MSPTGIALRSAGGGAGGAPPNLTRAALEMYEAKPTDFGAEPGSPLGQIAFQFNPKELSIQKSAKWGRDSAQNAKKASPVQFNGADPCKLTLELFFDATDAMDSSVVTRVDQLFSCCVPTDASLSRKKSSPPLVILHWGKVTSFVAFVTSVQAKYTLFTPDGTPIRATCSVSLEEMPGEPPKQNPTSGALAARALRTLVAGDTLASIAYREYGDPAFWRPLAAFNEIDDPMRLQRGLSLLIPTVEELLAPIGSGR